MSRSDLPAWIRLYVNMPDELADLSDRAFRVIVRLWCYSYRSGEYGTDGIVPRAIVEEYARGDSTVIDELVAARLLDPVIRSANEFASRFACANYTKWQESAAQRAEMRAKKQSAGSKGGKARAPASAVAVGEAPAQAPAQAPAKQNASKRQAEKEREKELKNLKTTTLLNDVERVKSNGHSTQQPTFAVFWEIYPRKIGKQAAERKFRTAAKTTDPQVIIDAARRYARDRERQDPKFTAHPATWLNQGRWDDETASVNGAGVKLGPTGRPWYELWNA